MKHDKGTYQQCTRCVMDTSDPYITFDANGACNLCTEFLSKTIQRSYQPEKSDKQLQGLIHNIKKAGKNNKYDCLIGVSGGVDSCYVLYETKRLGLKPLAVHLDNGWNSEEAVLNIKHACEILDIDYMSYVLDWKMFSDLQLSFLKASIVEMEIPTDIAIPGALHKLAAQYKIKYIISGGNFATEGILPNSWFYDPKDFKLLKAIHKKFGKNSIKAFPRFDYLYEIYYKYVKKIKIIYLLNYLPYEKDKAMSLLKEKLNWRDYGGKHYESKFTGFVQSYIQPVKFGVDYRKATYSTQICMGVLDRGEALESLKKLPYNEDFISVEIEYIAKKLGLSRSEFEAIMAKPVKTYSDYPNNEKWLTRLYRWYYIFNRKNS